MPNEGLAGTVRDVRRPTAADLDAAAAAVRAHLGPTPLVTSAVGLLKLECLQPTGSFKVRGALAALSQLSGEDRAAGVVTASAGNHGLAVAFAATQLGLAATIVVPTTASPAKVAALRAFPVTLVEHGEDYEGAERHALGLAGRGATYISAYNDTHVIAGAATIGVELAGEPGPLTVVVPVGGGGLISGVALWASQRPDVRVVGVEASASPAVSTAAAAGHPVKVRVEPTLADGLAGNLEAGSITPQIVAAHTHAVVGVSEAQIRTAIRFLAGQHGLVAEGSGAVGVAALLAGLVDVAGQPIALVTGRNITMAKLADILAG